MDLPNDHKVIELKWVYKVKKDAEGNLVKHKARLVAKGCVQDQGVDFEEVFAPVRRMESVRLLIALAAQESWRIHHMDVKSAFLTREIEDEIYVKQPPGYVQKGEEHKVLKLHKALYGLRQTPRAWNIKLDSTLVSLGFEKSSLRTRKGSSTSWHLRRQPIDYRSRRRGDCKVQAANERDFQDG